MNHHGPFFTVDDFRDGFSRRIQFGFQELGFFTGRRPGFAKITDSSAVPMEDILRNSFAARGLVNVGLPSPLDDLGQFPSKNDLVSPTILDVLGTGLNDAGGSIDVLP